LKGKKKEKDNAEAQRRAERESDGAPRSKIGKREEERAEAKAKERLVEKKPLPYYGWRFPYYG